MATARSNRRRERRRALLTESLWPSARLGEALCTLARSAGLPVTSLEPSVPPPDLEAENLTAWIGAAADYAGLQADQVMASINEVRALLTSAGPAVLRVRIDGRIEFLAITGGGRRFVSAIGPDLRVRRLCLETVDECLRQPFEAQVAPEVDGVLERLTMSARARERARAALLTDRLNAARFSGCWVLRLPAGSHIGDEAREAALPRGLVALVLAHGIQYVLFLVSWWVLGHGLLDGTIDTGWLWGWVLLLVSLIPFRLVASRMQGIVAVTAGAWLRRRLLRGAMRIDRQDVRRNGPGQFFGLVIEAGAVESLAIGGGVMALLALIELGLTTLVLWAGAGMFAASLLALWTAGAFWVAGRYVKHRRTWTRQRLSMTDRLLQCMVGHRTRLAQLPVDQWHKDEDESLNQYLESGKPMDRANLWLTAIVPRGWLLVAVAALTPALAAASSPEQMAVTVGGILLGYRGLRRLSVGLSSLAGAAIAGHSVLPLVRAASRRDAPTSPSLVVRSPRRQAAESEDVLAQARDVSFRYQTSRDPVLHGCNLRVARGARLLLEGPSGTGKTTLASILAGLQPADSGVVLVNGLDHSVLGRTGWHSRVVMAPQPHDNYLVSGTLAFNLLMGRRWPAQQADLAEAEKVCRELGLGDLLDRMPAGLQQVVGETGWQLSQGERTRVFLARALLQQPELLILDESWGSLDPENVERAVRCVTQRAPSVIAVAH